MKFPYWKASFHVAHRSVVLCETALLYVARVSTYTCEGSLWRALKGTPLKSASMSVPGEAQPFLVTQALACCFSDSLDQHAAISVLQARQLNYQLLCTESTCPVEI